MWNFLIQIFIKYIFNKILKTLFKINNYLTYLTHGSIEYQLEAHPIETNVQLLNFQIRSINVSWKNLIVPLQPRGTARYLNENYDNLRNNGIIINENNRRKTLVCHDMMGNYLHDRFFSSSKKWDDYRFCHWSGIDYFCYFSHKYITIPPSNWINAAHTHGVAVLGTFITEGSNGTLLLREVLESKEIIDAIIENLVRLCEHFCFEGWLINIECPVDIRKINNLIYFVNNLKIAINKKIENGIVLWYDSVIKTGQLSWQNEVNDQNIQFLNVSDGILINYSWNDTSLQRTQNIVIQENHKFENVYFGIDVFGRGQLAKYHSHRTLSRIVSYNFSCGIFAPGWTFEGLANHGYNIKQNEGDDDVNESFLLRNEKFWSLLWQHLPTYSYNKLPFYTDFCTGSGKYTFIDGKRIYEKFFNLSRQSLQPSIPLKNNAEHFFDDGINGGSCLKIIAYNRPFRLFLTEFHIKRTLIFAYAVKIIDSGADIDCILKLRDNFGIKNFELVCGNYENSWHNDTIFIKPVNYETFRNINQKLNDEGQPLKLPYQIEFDWDVRYYLAYFDESVIVQDIAVNLRTSLTQILPRAYLGAMYCHTVNDYIPSSSYVYTNSNYLK